MTVANPEELLSPCNILVVVTIGRITHAASVLEICRELHRNGHRITLAHMADTYKDPKSIFPFLAEAHAVCQPMDPDEDARINRMIDGARIETRSGRKTLAQAIQYWDTFYPDTYTSLRHLIQDRQSNATAQYHFILADIFDAAAIQLAEEFNIPHATFRNQFSFPIGRASFIPGVPGFQQHILSSENASLSQRMYEDFFSLILIWDMLPLFRARRRMQQQVIRKCAEEEARLHPERAASARTEIKDKTSATSKAVKLNFINSFWGFEIARAHTPAITMIGPILPETWSEITPELEDFLARRQKVVYVAFGTGVKLTIPWFEKLRDTLQALLDGGTADGVIWSIKSIPKVEVKQDSVSTKHRESDSSSEDANMLMLPWCPQRAILSHPSTKLFLSHAGGNSILEALYHGVPLLNMPVHGDQFPNALRCVNSGVGLSIDRDYSSVAEAVSKATEILNDELKTFERNSVRLMKIARTRARVGRLEAAARIEEAVFDHWSRVGAIVMVDGREPGAKVAGPHLQSPGERMSWWKRRNLDLYAAYLLSAASLGGFYHVSKLFSRAE